MAKRDLVLKTLDKTPAEMPKNFRSATSVCDLTGAKKDNTVNEMAKLRAELKFTKTQQLAAGAAASEMQRTTSTAPRRRLRLQQRQAPQETQGKYQGTFVTTVGEHGSIIVQSLTLNLTLGACAGASALAPCAPAQPLVGAQPLGRPAAQQQRPRQP